MRRPFPTGAAGVDLFFVISGFIMAGNAKGKTPGRFLSDRFWRIYPLWWIAVLPWMLWTEPRWERLAASVTLWPIYSSWQVPDLRVGWTLSFEMLFYCAMGLAIRLGAMPLLALYGIMLAAAFLTHWPLFYYLGNPMILEFLAGVLIAQAPKEAKLTLPLLGLALIVLAFSPARVGDGEMTLRLAAVWRVLWWGIPAALIVYACVSAEAAFQSHAWRFPLLLGNASYSIDLFHPAFMDLPVPWPIRFVVAVAAGVIVYWFIERRLLMMRRGRPPVTATVPD